MDVVGIIGSLLGIVLVALQNYFAWKAKKKERDDDAFDKAVADGDADAVTALMSQRVDGLPDKSGDSPR